MKSASFQITNDLDSTLTCQIYQNIAHAEKTTSMITQAAVPGAFLVDMLPFRTRSLCLPVCAANTLLVKHLPTWTPLTRNFREYGSNGRKMVQELITKPFDTVKLKMVSCPHPSIQIQRYLTSHQQSGQMRPSFTRDALLAYEEVSTRMDSMKRDEFEEIVRWVSGSLYGGMSLLCRPIWIAEAD